MPSSSGDRHRSHRSGKERSPSRESSRHRSSRDERSSSHSSSSRRDHKQRRRSRSPSEERGKASHKSTSSSKSTHKMIEETKNKMRAALAAADGGSSASSTIPDNKAVSSTSALEIASRHREIEMIDEDRGFAPESFLSSVGGRKPLRDGDNAVTLEKQDEHENAIFGQVSAHKGEMTNELEAKEGGGVSAYSKRPPCPLAHENLSIDPKVREEKWLTTWRAMRAKMLIN
uniref:Uncharacterized protein n=1 Tax=Plectus sambesii TaxID=2011161 RepID=A0A914W4U0_9BILA